MKKKHSQLKSSRSYNTSCLWFVLIILLSSCSAYRQSIMFNTGEEGYQQLAAKTSQAENSYIVQPFDQLEITVFTNKGESLIDPNNALETDASLTSENTLYAVSEAGTVKLPILGVVKLVGLSLTEANDRLANLYSVYYKDPFVLTKFANKRVIVLGASQTKVVPLPYEGMTLLEVLALAGGINETGKSSNIRLIRGDLRNPQVTIIDLSTITGMKQANLNILPNDIVYIEPAKKPLAGLRDVTPILGAITSILALIVALNR